MSHPKNKTPNTHGGILARLIMETGVFEMLKRTGTRTWVGQFPNGDVSLWLNGTQYQISAPTDTSFTLTAISTGGVRRLVEAGRGFDIVVALHKELL